MRSPVDRFDGLDKQTRIRAVGALYVLTGAAWLLTYPINVAEIEPLDTGYAALSLAFAAGSALLVFRLDVILLELGWGVFTYSRFVVFLDAIAEGPETLEALLPGTIELVGLAILLLGFAQTTTRLRTSLERRDQRLTVMNRILRHNLRNELVTILNALGHLQEAVTDDRDKRVARLGLESAESVSDLSEKLRRIDDVLENVDDGAAEVHELGSIVESVVDRYEESYPNVEFELTRSATLPVTSTRGVDIAIENVIENACEHNDAESPSVEITVRPADDRGLVVVEDNGSGIPSAELDPILAGRESDLTHGSGIGLWFVSWVLERSGGDLEFEYDGGQIVRMSFPRAKRPARRLDAVSDRFPAVEPG